MSTIKVNTLTTLNGSGNITVSRPLSGSGASLTALNATELTSGTIPIARIADDAVTTAKIAPDAITAAKIADDVINSEHYAAASIDNEHLADDAVGVAELSATGTASSSTFLRGDNAWAAAGGGKVLQTIVSDIKTSRSSTTSTTLAIIDSGWGAAITPTATSSKILIQVMFQYHQQGTNGQLARMSLDRNGTDIAPGASNSYPQGIWHGSVVDANTQWQTGNLLYLDSPNTTSAMTYKPSWAWENSTTSTTWTIGLSSGASDGYNLIILTEIGA